MNYRIVTDSSCGMSITDAAKNSVEIIPLGIIIDGQTYRDGRDITADEFYAKLTMAKSLPKTSQPTPAVYIEIFEDAKKKNEDVIVITISSGISGTYQCAEMAKTIVGYNRVFVIDSLLTIYAMNILVLEAINRQGQETEKVVDYLNDLKKRIKVIGVIDTLHYLKMGGRITKTAAFLGSLLNVKPLITFNEAKLEVIGKSRGLPHAFEQVIAFMKKYPIDHTYPVNFSYSDTDANCQKLRQIALKELDIKEYTIAQIGPVVGVHIGHRAAAVMYITKE